VGHFAPWPFNCGEVEFTTERSYPAGTREKMHVHDVATEIWEVTKGSVSILVKDCPPIKLRAGKMLKIFPGVPAGSYSKDGFSVRIVKYPSVSNDKRYV